MLFAKEFWPGIVDGSITVTFRRWKRPQAAAGRRYRTPAGIIETSAVDVVEPSEITARDARAAGFTTPEELLAQLRGTSDLPIYRIRFRAIDEPDPRDILSTSADLSPDDVAAITQRLDRFDRASAIGPWTRTTLRLIREHPHRRAPDLAEMTGRETQPFKRDVRKLKNLGLTLSFNPGYELSPRGEAYLRLVDER